MTTTAVQIDFHGTIAYVDDGNVAHMLLGSFDNLPAGVEPQVPHIRFHNDTLVSAGGREVVAPADGSDLRYIRLDGELLKLSDKVKLTRHLRLKRNENKDPDERTPVPFDRNSLHWLIHMDRLQPEAAAIDPELFDPGTRRVAARVDITRGFLQATPASDVQVKFTNGVPPQSISRGVELHLKVDGDSIELDSSPLAGTTRKKPLRFKATGDRLELTIGNEPVEDIFSPEPQITISDAASEADVAEFSLFYRMSKTRVRNPVLPQVRGRRPSGQLCIVPRFNTGG